MTSPVRALWGAPAASPAPPRRVWRDWALVGLLACLALFEASVRPEVPSRWLWAAVLAALAPTLLWRRTRPLTMLAIAFVVGTGVGLATGGEPQLYTTAYFLILLYAVFRWATGRAILLGGALVAAGVTLSFLTGDATLADTIGGIAVAVATGAVALATRARARTRARELDGVRMRERAELARDLHDTVAHHVSAIAIQAQAGTAVASTDPDAAARVLRDIEREASRTLHEMRSIVGLLRGTDAADLAPTPGLAELRDLARPDVGGPEVAVEIAGAADAVPPAIAAAVFRLAREAVSNARQHARNATRIDLRVTIDDAGVRLDVHDDGAAAASALPGHGLAGMRERAALLGGTCSAGPAPGGGWDVIATLPRRGWAA
ncbi:sensor histidine kinase [Microbacterium sp. CFH 90308]|uniref:histidine kinase n=1 Tax=Microbacterium salsuginis TaxID=2722803 RepID=A0ABX1KD81_9MICO|nr:histidine kinase [Microbacterium sp. CFH 90308]NLP84986.1 sensor histidine kinase [Microbacterium sp. CFH 90308]